MSADSYLWPHSSSECPKRATTGCQHPELGAGYWSWEFPAAGPDRTVRRWAKYNRSWDLEELGSRKVNLTEAADIQQAERYEAWFSSPFGRRADRVEKRMIRGLLADFSESRSLLEVGCGTGHFTEWFASRGLWAVGLDRLPSMLTFAQGRRPDLPFVLADATRLPFGDATFDVVALVTVLEFLDAPEPALREACRVARYGLILGVLNRLSPVALWRKLRRAAAYRSARFFSPGQLERLLRISLGYRSINIRWQTGLYPTHWLDQCTSLPFGAFAGLSVRFEEGG